MSVVITDKPIEATFPPQMSVFEFIKLHGESAHGRLVKDLTSPSSPDMLKFRANLIVDEIIREKLSSFGLTSTNLIGAEKEIMGLVGESGWFRFLTTAGLRDGYAFVESLLAEYRLKEEILTARQNLVGFRTV